MAQILNIGYESNCIVSLIVLLRLSRKKKEERTLEEISYSR